MRVKVVISVPVRGASIWEKRSTSSASRDPSFGNAQGGGFQFGPDVS
jgi:hypothetical protein